MDHPIVPIAIGAALLGLLSWGLIEAVKADHRSWVEFSTKYDCKLVAERRSYTMQGFGTTGDGKWGPTTTFVPATKTYRCNNGIEYTR